LKFLHAADLHIDSPLRGLDRREGAPIEEIRRAPRDAFKALIQLALDEAVDFVILAGDIYDGTWRDMGTGQFFLGELRRLGSIPVFIVNGNHDAESVITNRLRPSLNVTYFSSEHPETHVLEHLKVALHGQSYAKKAVYEDLASNYPERREGYINIGVLHTSLGGYGAHESYAPTTVSILQSKRYDYWALGHVHTRQTISDVPLIVFPGNIQGRDIGETGPKGCYVVTYDVSSEAFTLKFAPLDVVRWNEVEVPLTDEADVEAAIATATRCIAEAADGPDGRLVCIRATLTGAVEFHAELYDRRAEIEAQLRLDAGAHPLWVESVMIRTSTLTELKELRLRGDLVGGLFRTIELARTDEALRGYLSAELNPLRSKLGDIVEIFDTSVAPGSAFDTLIDEAEALLAARVSE
jgi:exonuclease SbcD